MYISIKLPPAYGALNRLRMENYPFNQLFTKYLKKISSIGLSLGMDVDELVGLIEDKAFEGQRLPDIPEGDGAVNIRFRTEDPDIVSYIGSSNLTNRSAVMYITRMTLRLSAGYGTSLLRLIRIIDDLDLTGEAPVRVRTAKAVKEKAVKEKAVKESAEEESVPTPVPGLRLSGRAKEPAAPAPSKTSESIEAAKAAAAGLASAVKEAERTDVVETNPALSSFFN